MPTAATGTPATPLTGRRILIVEDELVVAMDVEGILEDHGCTVIGPAPTTTTALALIEAETPDAALLDLNLNGESSAPVADELARRNVPFVVLSGYRQERAEASALREAAWIDKPLEERKVVLALIEALEQSGQA